MAKVKFDYKKLEREWNKSLHPPYIQVVLEEEGMSVVARDTMTNAYLASGYTKAFMNLNLNRFFSIENW
jgi:hypothetical protein